MKKESLKPKKYSVITTQDIVYTFSHWDTKEIDGVEFLPVCKQMPSQDVTQQLYYMRKDSLTPIK
jgi:hypothetical protein